MLMLLVPPHLLLDPHTERLVEDYAGVLGGLLGTLESRAQCERTDGGWERGHAEGTGARCLMETSRIGTVAGWLAWYGEGCCWLARADKDICLSCCMGYVGLWGVRRGGGSGR